MLLSSNFASLGCDVSGSPAESTWACTESTFADVSDSVSAIISTAPDLSILSMVCTFVSWPVPAFISSASRESDCLVKPSFCK